MALTPSQPGSIAITSPTGNEIVSVNSGPVWTSMTTQQIANLSAQTSSTKKATALNTVGNGSLTAAALLGQFVIRGGAQSSTPFTDTTVSGPTIIAALPAGAPVGTSFAFDYVNNTNAVATIAAGSGVTINSGITPTGTVTVPPNSYASFLIVEATASTVTMTQIGNGGFTADSADTTKVMAVSLSGNTTGVTSTLAFADTANTTHTVPPVSGTIGQTSGSNLNIDDVYRSTSAQTANANVTYASIPGLSGNVAVGTYRFRAVLPSTVAAGAGGIKYAFHYTNSAALSALEATGIGYTASAVAVQHTTTTTDVADLFSQAAVVIMTILEGTFTVSTAGTITLQMAQNTSNGSNSVTLVGSSLEFCRIA